MRARVLVLKEKMTAQKKGSSIRTGIIVGVVAATCVAAAAFAGSNGVIQIPGIGPRLELTRASTAPIFQPPPGAPLSFADIFERVSPAVVSIVVKSNVPVPNIQDQLRQQFPGLPPGILPFGPQGGDNGGDDEDTQEATAEGSGFFISADGYIVTNNHVVEDATDITVKLTDKRELKATVIGKDEATDLAVIKVEGRSFPFVNFENSATPRVGDWVISIGNPFGLGGTATAGIVSAYNRTLPEQSSTFVDFLQIDSAINRGNSGGPTFDVYGRVIGVNSAIYSPSQAGGSVGIGFAIPANVAESVTKQLIERGSIARGYLGARIQAYNKELAEGLGMNFPDGSGGAYIEEVVKDGPAEKAGLEQGDVVLSINGQKVADATALTRAVAASHTGDTLRLEVLRDGRTRTINVKSGSRPTEAELNAPAAGGRGGGKAPGRGGGEDKAAGPSVIGLELGSVDEGNRRQYSIPAGVTGVVVVGVDGSTQASRILKPGDVIQRAAGKTVTKPSEVQAAIASQLASNRTTILMIIRRGEDTASVLIPLDDKPGAGRGGGRGGAGGGAGRGGR